MQSYALWLPEAGTSFLARLRVAHSERVLVFDIGNRVPSKEDVALAGCNLSSKGSNERALAATRCANYANKLPGENTKIDPGQ
jgi:hypothetical protein